MPSPTPRPTTTRSSPSTASTSSRTAASPASTTHGSGPRRCSSCAGPSRRGSSDDLRAAVDRSGLTAGATTVAEVLGRADGPSLSGHMAREGTRAEFVEFCVHRSAYQLKEADPHSWGLLRLSGPRKAALVEIQADEYGNGRVGEAHADLFADVLTALDVDASYGAHLDAIPAVTLATDNVVTLFGSHRRLRSALLGHLAGFEMTSVAPMSAYAQRRPPARPRPGGRALLRRARRGRRAPRRPGVESPRRRRPRGRRPLDPRHPLRRRRHVGARGPLRPPSPRLVGPGPVVAADRHDDDEQARRAPTSFGVTGPVPYAGDSPRSWSAGHNPEVLRS